MVLAYYEIIKSLLRDNIFFSFSTSGPSRLSYY